MRAYKVLGFIEPDIPYGTIIEVSNRCSNICKYSEDDISTRVILNKPVWLLEEQGYLRGLSKEETAKYLVSRELQR